MRFLFLLPLFLLAACLNDLTPPTADSPPTMKPAAPAPLGSLVSCAGLPNVGNIWKVEISPPGPMLIPLGGSAAAELAVVRDDASWPGLQSYCQDNTKSANFWVSVANLPYISTYCEGSCTNTRRYRINPYTSYSGTKPVFACYTNTSGGPCASAHRDTVFVDQT